MISERISDDIPPQMNILNMVIPILMHFCSLISNFSVKAARHPTKCDVINDVKLFPTVNRSITVFALDLKHLNAYYMFYFQLISFAVIYVLFILLYVVFSYPG